MAKCILAISCSFLILISSVFASPTIGGSFSLTDNTGRKVTEKTFHGKYQLVFFGFTRCPSACPTGLYTMSQVLNRLGEKSSEFQPLFISVDPKRDTEKVLTKFLADYGKNFIGLRGEEAEVESLIKKYRGYYQKLPAADEENYSFDHSTLIYFMDKNGNYLAHYDSGEGAEKIAEEIKKHLSK